MRRLLLSIAILPVLATTVLAASEVALFVRANDVNLRDGPGADQTTVIGILQLGDEVRVRTEEGQWREVWCPRIRKTGWVAHWLLDEAPPPGVRREVAAVNCDDLCLRAAPSQSANARATLARGTLLDVIAYEGQWRKVRIPSTGQVGWVAAWLLRASAPQSSGASAPSGSGVSRYVKADRLYLRTGPGVENQAFAVLLQGTPVRVLEVADPWTRVEVAGGLNGWLHRDYLGLEGVEGAAGGVQVLDADQMRQSFDPELEVALQQLRPDQAYVTADASNVRYGPGPQYPVRMTVNRATVFQVVGANGGWYRGVFADGAEGWLAGWLCIAPQAPPEIAAVAVSTPPNVPAPAAAGAAPEVGPGVERGRQIAEKALTMLGQPYRWSGASPGGFDCSGLVTWAHGQLGISVPRSSYDQWDAGQSVSSENLLPGDVVCFAGTSGPGVSHVGIYIGNGNFVHSPQTGEVVRVQSLASRSRSFCGARRFW